MVNVMSKQKLTSSTDLVQKGGEISMADSPTPKTIPGRSEAFSLCCFDYRTEWSFMGLRALALSSSQD